jgi:hypothetical protein
VQTITVLSIRKEFNILLPNILALEYGILLRKNVSAVTGVCDSHHNPLIDIGIGGET